MCHRTVLSTSCLQSTPAASKAMRCVGYSVHGNFPPPPGEPTPRPGLPGREPSRPPTQHEPGPLLRRNPGARGIRTTCRRRAGSSGEGDDALGAALRARAASRSRSRPRGPHPAAAPASAAAAAAAGTSSLRRCCCNVASR